MKELDFDVLAWEGPMLRAYLGILHFSGFRPKRIIRVVESPGNRPSVLPSFVRVPYLRWAQNLRNNYWVRWGALKHGDFFKSLLHEAARSAGLEPEFAEKLQDYLLRRDIHTLFDCPKIDIPVAGLKDPALKSGLEKLGPRALLFTGGGLVPQALFSIKGMRIIHVHPGYLPGVRGADGLLYSILLRGRPGASAFYMLPGLDEGDIILKKEFLPLHIEKQDGMDNKSLYRLLYACVDPVFRAGMLLDLISLAARHDNNFEQLPAVAQDATEGETYYFMHPRLQHRVFALLSS